MAPDPLTPHRRHDLMRKVLSTKLPADRKSSPEGKAKVRLGLTIGWREHVALPELGIADMRAKIDTGARTSAIHAKDMELFQREGEDWVRFRIPASRHHKRFRIEAPVLDQRDIKNTSGVPERRIVIRALLVLGSHRWHVDLSLADREKMGFDMILGRTAIRNRGILVSPGRSFIAGPPLIEPGGLTLSDSPVRVSEL